jgi:hypothetical protein
LEVDTSFQQAEASADWFCDRSQADVAAGTLLKSGGEKKILGKGANSALLLLYDD